MGKGGLTRVLSSVFGSASSKKETEGRPRAKPQDAGGPRKAVRSEAVLRVDQGLYGSVYVLALREFYDALGGRSGRLAESVVMICEKVFEDRTGRDDRFSLIDEDHFMFRFQDMDSPRAFEKASEIVREIGTKLLGEHFVSSGKFKAVMAAVKVEHITDDKGIIDREKVAVAVDVARHGKRRGAPADEEREPEPIWKPLRFRDLSGDNAWLSLSGPKSEVELRWEAIQHEKKQTAIEWQPISHRSAKREVQWEEFRVDGARTRREILNAEEHAEFDERRQGTDRRQRQKPFLGPDRRSYDDRRRQGDRRRA
jgi:hypothetical protein